MMEYTRKRKKSGFIKEAILKNRDLLLNLVNHRELYNWAKRNDMDNAPAFSTFKRELKAITGRDYEKERQKYYKPPEPKREVELTVYSDFSKNMFAIVQDGKILWCNSFSEEDKVQAEYEAEMSVAKKAVYLVKKLADHLKTNLKAVILTGARWLSYSNEEGDSISKRLVYYGNSKKTVVEVKYVVESEDEAVGRGFVEKGDYHAWETNLGSIRVKKIGRK